MTKVSLVTAFAATVLATIPPVSAQAPALPSWQDQMNALKDIAEPLVIQADRGGSEKLRQDMYVYILGAVSTGYLNYVNADPARPTWSPLWNYAYNYGGPNPDYAYLHNFWVQRHLPFC
jgi:hypothetical protein